MTPAASTASATGYTSPVYAQSFAQAGEPMRLPRSGGWLLRRSIAASGRHDLIGLYPVFCCEDWDGLAADLDGLPSDLASVTLVPDPFARYAAAGLEAAFDFVRPYKDRYVVALDRPLADIVSRHHRKYADKGLAGLDVAYCADPAAHLDEWVPLYAQVCVRHGITDHRAFSAEAFEVQLRTPGLAMFRARHDGRTVAIHLWMVMGDVAYGHLAGHDERAYGLHAAYALYWTALEWLASRVRLVDLGGAADGPEARAGGLDFFKQGWSSGTRPGLLCGRVINAGIYSELATASRAPSTTSYFPAYRAAPVPT